MSMSYHLFAYRSPVSSPIDDKPSKGSGESGLAFLTDLPKLDRKPDPEMKSIDKNLADLGFGKLEYFPQFATFIV